MLTIPAGLVEEMLAHLRAAYPDEGCGLLGGLDSRVSRHYPAANVEPENKRIRYLVDPQTQLQAESELDEAGLELTAIYHSHTHSRAYPSPTDVRTAYYPDSYYVLVSLRDPDRPDIRAYRIIKPDPWGDQGEIVEQPLKLE